MAKRPGGKRRELGYPGGHGRDQEAGYPRYSDELADPRRPQRPDRRTGDPGHHYQDAEGRDPEVEPAQVQRKRRR